MLSKKIFCLHYIHECINIRETNNERPHKHNTTTYSHTRLSMFYQTTFLFCHSILLHLMGKQAAKERSVAKKKKNEKNICV